MVIADLQRHIGVEPDGIWGNRSREAVRNHLRKLMPDPNPWPARIDVRTFYGPPPPNDLTRINVEGLGVFYSGAEVKTIRCHEKVAESLLSIIQEISESEYRDLLRKYAGCYAYRKSRSSANLSMHAWGIAIDFDPANNGNYRAWPLTATMPIQVMEIFARRGWVAAGAFWGRDAMHFEAVKPQMV